MNDWREYVYKIFEQNNNNIDIKETKIGIVQSVSPLQICIGELVLYKENLYINEDLLEYSRKFTIPEQTATGKTIETEPERKIITAGFDYKTIIFHCKLHVGDMVALRKLPFEKYYVENKVIKGSDL